MAGRDMIVMSLSEVKRLKLIQSAIDRHMTQKTAASMMGISERQVRRLVKVVREGGRRIIDFPTRSKRRQYLFTREDILILGLPWRRRSF
jgi:DNA-binding transcriptional regulator LsrR (DeoR family)